MSNLLMLAPTPIILVSASSGSGASNLLTPSPKEVWADTATGTASFSIDFGATVTLDTLFLGHILPPAAGATWVCYGGIAGAFEINVFNTLPLRAVDSAGQFPAMSHALWRGSPVNVRYLSLQITQPAGSPTLTAGVLMAGKAFVPLLNQEWGAGRRVIDTGSVSPLVDGGFAVVEGARKAGYAWTLGDLSSAEVDTLYALQLDRGESRPLLVVEDPAATTGQRNRIHYGLLRSLRAFERRNPVQTRWELSMEEWA